MIEEESIIIFQENLMSLSWINLKYLNLSNVNRSTATISNAHFPKFSILMISNQDPLRVSIDLNLLSIPDPHHVLWLFQDSIFI